MSGDNKPPIKLHDIDAFSGELGKTVHDSFPGAFEGEDQEDPGEKTPGVPVRSMEKYELCWAGKAQAVRSAEEPSRSVFIPCPEKSVDFDSAPHILIEGENLETLKLLQEEYREKVKMIYIDPPYNKGKDFVYSDDFTRPLRDYLRQTGQEGKQGTTDKENLETAGRFHSDWLSMMYPRLVLARRLLREDGAIFVSIDDNEAHNLRLIMNEIFGEENFVNTLHVKRAAKNVNQQFSDLKKLNLGVEYVLVYRKSPAFSWIDPHKEALEKRKQGYWTSFYNNADRPTMRYELLGVNISQGQWKWRKERAQKAVDNYMEFKSIYSFENEKEELRLLKEFWLETGKKKEFIKLRNARPHYWVNPSAKQLRTTDWTDIYINDNYGKGKYGFDTAKSVKAMKTLIRSATCGSGETEDIILDFFAGSGTTGEAVMALNKEQGGMRKYICVQIPVEVINPVKGKEVPLTIADICRKRLADCALRYDTGLKVYRLSGG